MARKGIRAAIAAAVPTAVALVVWHNYAANRNLDRIGTGLCQWQEQRAGTAVTHGLLLNDYEVLEEESVLIGRTLGPVKRATLLDPARGTRRGLGIPVIDAAITRGGSPLSPSPDGRWMGAWTNGRDSSFVTFVGMRGGPVLRFPSFDAGRGDVLWYGWSPDSRAYLVLFARKLARFRLDSAGTIERVSLPQLPQDPYVAGALREGILISSWRALNHVTDRLPAFVLRVEGRPSLQPYPIRQPPGRIVHVLMASPQGDRLAWETEDAPLKGWLPRILAPFGYRSRPRFSFWVSRPDGTDMREVGYVGSHGLQLFGWAPGGKRLAFIRHGYLCTVAADE